MRHLAVLAALLLSACTPCDQVAAIPGNLDDLAAVCWITTDAADDTGTTGTDTDVTGGGLCEQAPGLVWGPCNDAGSCDAGPGTFCIQGQIGNICAPACDDGGCPDLGCEMAGECLPTGACVPDCTSDADCTVGMVCDSAIGVCVWPTDDCAPALSELWGPCPDGSCKEGLCTSGPGGETLCVPSCVDGVACTPSECGPPSPAPICQTSGLCGYACDLDHPCDDGQACVSQGPISVCMWQ